MHSSHTSTQLSQWLRWASEQGNTPSFVRTVAEAARMACMPDYALQRPVLLELKRRHPDTPLAQMRTNAPTFLGIGVSERV